MTNFIDTLRAKAIELGNYISGNYFSVKENGTVELVGTIFNGFLIHINMH